MDSEWNQFLDTLKRLGIKHYINWGPTKEEYQENLNVKYNITALACNGVVVGDVEYLFSSGQPIWEVSNGIVFGHGPEGSFLLSKNLKTGEVIYREGEISRYPLKNYGEE